MEPKVNIVPGFIMKLWKMVNDSHCNDLIAWSETGQSFIIIDPPKFSQELSKYFKHNNLSSFIRQLNMYGFRKVATIENSGLNPGTEDLHFYHPEFIKGHRDRLENIKRKLPQKLAETVDLKNVYQGISEIDERQKDVAKTLDDLKQENRLLWQELHELRQKHHQQQLYINRLMKLVYEAMEQNGIKTNVLQVRHNPPLMIEGGTTTPTGTGLDATATNTTTSNAGSPEAFVDQGVELNPTTMSPTGNNMGLGATVTNPGDNFNCMPSAGDTLGTPNPALMDDSDMFSEQAASTLSDQTSPFDTFQAPVGTHNTHLQSQVDAAEHSIDALVPTIGEFENDEFNLFMGDTN